MQYHVGAQEVIDFEVFQISGLGMFNLPLLNLSNLTGYDLSPKLVPSPDIQGVSDPSASKACFTMLFK